MVRKNLLSSVLGEKADRVLSESRSNYAFKGASGKMKASIDTLASNSKKLVEGQTIIEVEADLIDVSFVNDRLSGDDEEFNNLKEAIKKDGQNTPVLLRSNPEQPGLAPRGFVRHPVRR